MKLTPHQSEAVDLILDRITHNQPTTTLGGYAGTGKTYLLSQLIPVLKSEHKLDVRIVAPTGKAASVLRSKGVSATTIHRLCYELVSTKPLTFEKKNKLDCDVVICDESSMIPLDIYNDLLSYNIPILFVGDPGQLEPVGKDPNIMASPDFTLTEVHRQALDNPIIAFATWLRENPHEFPQRYANNHPSSQLNIHRGILAPNKLPSFDQIIVGTNLTRVHYNELLRRLNNFNGPNPNPGQRLICLSNSRRYNLFNGLQVVVGPYGYKPSSNELHILRDDWSDLAEPELIPLDTSALNTPKFSPVFGQKQITIPFDYAYAITCHKSQGSEWSNVCVVDQAFGNPPNRWRYTAATRAKESLTWLC
jgi:exodeoxyribonuclease-5